MSELDRRVHDAIEEAKKRNQEISKRWLTHGIINAWAPPEGPDSEVYKECAYRIVADIIGRKIRQHPIEPSPQTNLAGPGFEGLQSHYQIERDGEPCLVPITEMTVDECRQKTRQMRTMAVGLNAHADRLDAWADALEAGPPEAVTVRRAARKSASRSQG
jgi:hypothetical protein